MDEALTEELLELLRTQGPIINILRRAYELGFERGFAAGVQDDTLKEMLG